MAFRRGAGVAGAAMVAAAFAVGVLQTDAPPSGSADPLAPSVAQARAQIAGAPQPLASLFARSNALLPEPAFDRLLASVRGYPVVVNIWASYCGPCRREFAMLRRAAARHGRRVAFIGVNADATAGPAQAFLRRNATVYPHVRDPDGRIANRLGAGIVLPSTVILNSRGTISTVFVGEYPDLARLERDLSLRDSDAVPTSRRR